MSVTFLAPTGIGPKQLEALLQVPLDVLLVPWRVASARADAARVADRLVQGGLDLVRDVRLAFADVILARTAGTCSPMPPNASMIFS